MSDQQRPWRLSNPVLGTINRLGALLLLFLGGMIFGLGWYELEVEDAKWGLQAMIGGSGCVMAALMLLEEARVARGEGSKKLKVFYLWMLVTCTAFGFVMLLM